MCQSHMTHFNNWKSSKGTDYVEVENENLDTFLKEKRFGITFDLEANSMYTCKKIRYSWMNKNNCNKIS